METFIPLKKFAPNPRFQEQRAKELANLDLDEIDPPLRDLIQGLSQQPYCFTLQCCYGHFVHKANQDRHSIAPLPNRDPGGSILYRLAYLTIALEQGPDGLDILREFEDIRRVDPEHIQVGCSSWFWDNQVNTFVIQAEPDRYKHQDTATVNYREAKRLERARGLIFEQLGQFIKHKLAADSRA